MPINHEPEPAPYHVVLHFKEKPFYFSTYVLALIEKYAIEVAQEKLKEHAQILEAGEVKPYYATVTVGDSERHFVRRAGEWLELEVWRQLKALDSTPKGAARVQSREARPGLPNSA